MKTLTKLFFSLALLVAAMTASITYAAITLTPAQPRTLETISVAVDVSIVYVPTARPSITMVANKITLIGQMQQNSALMPSVPMPTFVMTYNLGQLPAGQYTLEFRPALNSADITTTTFVVSDAPPSRITDYPGYNFSDIWWNPAESGWGMSIHVKNDNLFAAWFAYDQSGRPQWYTFQAGSWSTVPGSANTSMPITFVYTGKVVKTSGPSFAGIDNLQSAVSIVEVGNGIIRFSGYNSGTFTGTVEGRTFNKSIIRQAF